MAQVIPITRQAEAPQTCRALTASGRRCRNRAAGPDGYCGIHRRSRRRASEEDRLGELLSFLRRRLTGQYEVDEFGFDRELTEEVLAPLARFIHERWWRVDWIGMENMPSAGGALLVTNHAGTLPWDALMLQFGVLDRHPERRHVRLLAADLAFRFPLIGPLARKSGSTVARAEDAYRLLGNGESWGCSPRGSRGWARASASDTSSSASAEAASSRSPSELGPRSCRCR